MRLRRMIPGVLALAVVLSGCDAANADSDGAGAETALATGFVVNAELPVVTMYKNPTCACCGDWADHMRGNGFRVDVKEGESLGEVKAENGIPIGMASCHTSLVGDYVLEGHVPADVVLQLVREKPDVHGLAVPGMPAGVPGMPDPGPNRDPYEIVAIQHGGGTQVYATR